MISEARDLAAKQPGFAGNHEAIRLLPDIRAQPGERIPNGVQAIALLDAQPGGVYDMRLPLRGGGYGCQHRDEIRDFPGIDAQSNSGAGRTVTAPPCRSTPAPMDFKISSTAR